MDLSSSSLIGYFCGPRSSGLLPKIKVIHFVAVFSLTAPGRVFDLVGTGLISALSQKKWTVCIDWSCLRLRAFSHMKFGTLVRFPGAFVRI